MSLVILVSSGSKYKENERVFLTKRQKEGVRKGMTWGKYLNKYLFLGFLTLMGWYDEVIIAKRDGRGEHRPPGDTIS